MRVQDALKLTDAEIANIIRFERGNGLISTTAITSQWSSRHLIWKSSSLPQTVMSSARLCRLTTLNAFVC